MKKGLLIEYNQVEDKIITYRVIIIDGNIAQKIPHIEYPLSSFIDVKEDVEKIIGQAVLNSIYELKQRYGKFK